MKNKRIFLLLVVCMTISSCSGINLNQNYDDPPIFELLTISDDNSIVYYAGLTPDISTVDDVILAMNETGLMKQDGKENPFIGHNGSGQTVYDFGLVPEAKHYVNFTFTSENYLELMSIYVRDTHVGEFIDAYGEPTAVLFSITKRFSKEVCGLMMLYDEFGIIVHLGIGLPPDVCILSQDTTIANLHVYSDQAYEAFLAQLEMEIPGTLDDYLSPWQGYGDMVELYPDYLLEEK